MDPFSIFLLLLQVQVVQVSSFTPPSQEALVRSAGILSQQRNRWNSLSNPVSTTVTTIRTGKTRPIQNFRLSAESTPGDGDGDGDGEANYSPQKRQTYDLGVGKNLPVGTSTSSAEIGENIDPKSIHWVVPENPNGKKNLTESIKGAIKYSVGSQDSTAEPRRVRKMVARTDQSNKLRNALWHEEHYSTKESKTRPASAVPSRSENATSSSTETECTDGVSSPYQPPELFYPNIDLSIPPSVYDPQNSIDIVWDLMQWEAYQEAQREPLLVSFLYSSILNHDSLESSLAFLLANKLSSAAMISTQVQSLILDALKKDPSIGRAVRADIMAVRDRDPACTCLPDVFLYFKGFHALQTYRVANAIWKADNKQVLAHYLQSQMSQTFQIDIHPNATLGSGIMLDHGTGIVIGETAHLGHNCSILHHVTLGGSGKKGVDRHPKVGDGVLLGAGASVLGNVKIGDGCQVGAGGLVITDLPPHSVAVGVPVKIIGSFVDVTEQPSIEMNQMMNQTFLSEGI